MNANTYTRISASDFETFLADEFGEFEQASVPGTRELVYDLPVGDSDEFVVRVFSSLTREGQGRDAGRDAIKAVVWSNSADRPVATATRTNRITTWRKNLAPKITEMFERAEVLAREQAAEEDVAVAAIESLPVASGDDSEVVVSDLSRTRYGAKAYLASPFAAKDAIKSLDWDATHRAWDADAKAWTVDAETIGATRDHLAAEGWTLVRADLEAESDEFDVADFAEDAFEGDRVTIEYTPKNGGDAKTVSGTIERVAADFSAFTFTRESDAHRMFVREGDELHTSGSHYPFVGTVVGVSNDSATSC